MAPSGTSAAVGAQPAFEERPRRKYQTTRARNVQASEEGGAHAQNPRRPTHRGFVKNINEEKGFAFIACAELYPTYQKDVFVKPHQLEGFMVRDHVTFTVKVDKKGQPQAHDVKRAEPGSEMAELVAEHKEVKKRPKDAFRFTGTIKSYSAENGYGFLTSPEALDRFGSADVFLHSKQIGKFSTGDVVTFSVRVKDARPQACDLQAPPVTMMWLAASGPAEADSHEASPEVDGKAVDSKEEHVGEVKSFNAAKGYGFIGCPDLHERFGRDVFIHQCQFEGLKVGDRVTFRVQVKKGQPQAHDVAPCAASTSASSAAKKAASGSSSSSSSSSAAPAPAAAGPAPPRTAGQPRAAEAPAAEPTGNELAELNRKLARACASALRTSAETIAALLAQRADPNVRDVTGQSALMISALNVRHAERKCRILIEHRADVAASCGTAADAVSWARERINPKFAEFLAAASRGERLDYTVAIDAPYDEF